MENIKTKCVIISMLPIVTAFIIIAIFFNQRVKESGYYYVDLDGNILNDEPFLKPGGLFNEEGIAFVSKIKTNSGGYGSAIVDSKGNVVGNRFFDPDDILVVGDVRFPLIVRDGDKLAILDENLDKIGELEGDYNAESAYFLSCFESGLGLVGLEENGKLRYGYINADGKWVISPRFTEAKPFSEYGIAMVKENGSDLYGLIDTEGNYITEDRFFDAHIYSKYPLVQKEKGGKAAFINSKGDYITDYIYGFYTSGFSEGLASVDIYGEDKWGYINEQGEMVLDPVYSGASSNSEFSHGVAWVDLGKAIDKEGNIVLDGDYKHTRAFSSDGYAVVEADKIERSEVRDYYGVIDINGNWVLEPQFPAETRDGHPVMFPEYKNGYLSVYLEKGQRIKKPKK